MLNLNGAGWCLVVLDEVSDSLSLRARWREERWNWRRAAADWQALHLDGILVVCLKTRPPNRLIEAGIEAIRDNVLCSYGSQFGPFGEGRTPRSTKIICASVSPLSA